MSIDCYVDEKMCHSFQKGILTVIFKQSLQLRMRECLLDSSFSVALSTFPFSFLLCKGFSVDL